MPKSSIAIRTPGRAAPASSARARSPAAPSSTIAVSVTSRPRSSAGSPAVVERVLHERVDPAGRQLLAGQVHPGDERVGQEHRRAASCAVCSQASRSTNSPSGHDQAGRLGDRDEAGPAGPRRGWGSSSAAAPRRPTISSLSSDDLRLVVDAELARAGGRGAARARARAARRTRAPSRSGRPRSGRGRPPSRRTSRRPRGESGPRCSAGPPAWMTMPTLAPSASSRPAIAIGSRELVEQPAGDRRSPAARRRRRAADANSSPPSRARVSLGPVTRWRSARRPAAAARRPRRGRGCR